MPQEDCQGRHVKHAFRHGGQGHCRVPPALDVLAAIMLDESLSQIGRFNALVNLGGRRSIKLCPQPSSRDPFVLVTETTLFWSVMGTKDERMNGKQDPALNGLRKRLLAAISKPGSQALTLESFNSEIERAFSSSRELCVMDILLPGLASDKRRYQTPAEAQADMDAANAKAKEDAIAKATQGTDYRHMTHEQREEHIQAVIKAVRPARPTKRTRLSNVMTDGYTICHWLSIIAQTV
ncbi:hypothetical protein BC831DRAFT_138981 [Entophlyctis helioformis]|nr:hypothetical protein BC831DRAFT_138981 [Entophlyctis helioformis]